jgi:hypothetical protein
MREVAGSSPAATTIFEQCKELFSIASSGGFLAIGNLLVGVMKLHRARRHLFYFLGQRLTRPHCEMVRRIELGELALAQVCFKLAASCVQSQITNK